MRHTAAVPPFGTWVGEVFPASSVHVRMVAWYISRGINVSEDSGVGCELSFLFDWRCLGDVAR